MAVHERLLQKHAAMPARIVTPSMRQPLMDRMVKTPSMIASNLARDREMR